MILDLRYKLFTEPPEMNKYGLNLEEIKQIVYRKKMLEYKPNEILEYIKVVLKKDVTEKQMYRILSKYDVYNHAQILIRKGETSVHILYFNEHIGFIKDYYKGADLEQND
jgi:hypothetical protein